MPRSVRNFWLNAHVDGRGHCVSAGPRARSGGFTLEVFYRERGEVARPLRLVGRCLSHSLVLDLYDGGITVFHKEVER